MIETYGELILPKGFILYHTSDELFEIKPKESHPILFCVFHPSEWELNYITKIILKKDISLFFAIDFNPDPLCIMKKITKTDFFIKNVKSAKNYLLLLSSKLKENNFDGWVGLQKINNIEVGLINDNYDFETEPLKKDWKREGMNYNKTIVIQKNWGLNYRLFFKNTNLKINKRYKDMIELYLENKTKYKFNKCLQVLLRDAIIEYHEGVINDINWNNMECKISIIDRFMFK
jgi:hypothetical protein